MANAMSGTKEAKMLSKSFGPRNFFFILFFSKLDILFKFYFDSQQPKRLEDTVSLPTILFQVRATRVHFWL